MERRKLPGAFTCLRLRRSLQHVSPGRAARVLSAKVVTRTLHCVKRVELPGGEHRENETGPAEEARRSPDGEERTASIVSLVKPQTAPTSPWSTLDADYAPLSGKGRRLR